MSDTDYINDHMGGFDDDGLPNFLSSGDGKGGMDGYGDVDYSFYHIDRKGILSILYAIRMTYEAVKTLPYISSGKTSFRDKCDLRFQNPQILGVSDGWDEIHNVFEMLLDCTDISADYFVFIQPDKGVLNVSFVDKNTTKERSSIVEFHKSPESGVDESEWRFGVHSALGKFETMLKTSSLFSTRLTKEQFLEYLAHRVAVRDILLEIEYLNESEDKKNINDRIVKGKLFDLVTEMESFGSPSYKRTNLDEIKILVEISTKDNLMPTFKIEPSKCRVYNLYEMSPRGDVISLHFMSNKTLKEKYSLVDGIYSVPLLDLIKVRKIADFEYLYKV